jgi:hypothetical protein
VAATARVKPRGGAAAVWMVATSLFNLATLAAFAASVDQVVPWYSRRN